MKTPWIKCSDRLPEEGIYVLARQTRDDNEGEPQGESLMIAVLHHGISINTRDKMKSDELPDPGEIISEGLSFGNIERSNKRSWSYEFCDEHGNNIVPYAWEGIGCCDQFGQDVDYWMPIPALPVVEGEE